MEISGATTSKSECPILKEYYAKKSQAGIFPLPIPERDVTQAQRVQPRYLYTHIQYSTGWKKRVPDYRKRGAGQVFKSSSRRAHSPFDTSPVVFK